ncbi:hypothetical protein C0991_000094 [Blastosporella zonata]|nr:hypothetical protein C0991_000094 [Blastosporella zonata]
MLNDIHSESLAQLLAQVHPSPNTPRLLHSHLGPGDVVEIQGGPSSGKTHLLYHLLIACISPSLHGGCAKVAVVFDTDNTFDIVRFNHLLIRRLARLDPTSAESIAHRSLKKLHIFRPSSTTQLATTLSHLAAYHSYHLADEEIGVVAIDSISSHYWSDRFIAEQMPTPPSSLTRAPPLHHVLLALKSFTHTHRPVVLMTNWGLHLFHDSTSLYRQHLRPFPTLHLGSNPTRLTCHITLHRVDPSSLESQGQVQISGLVRKPNSSSVAEFSLYITAEDIFTE